MNASLTRIAIIFACFSLALGCGDDDSSSNPNDPGQCETSLSPTGSSVRTQVVISSVDFQNDIVVLTNLSDTSVPLNGWQFCHRIRSYGSIPTHNLAAGASITLHLTDDGTATDTDLFLNDPSLDLDSADELALYSTANDFDDDVNMESFVAWGTDPSLAPDDSRVGVAVDAQLWTAGSFVNTSAVTAAGVVARGDTTSAAGYIAQPANCF